MAKQTVLSTNFTGSISPYKKINSNGAFPNSSFRFVDRMNPNEDPNEITLTPKPSKVSASTVTGLVKWIVDASPYDTNRYAYDDNGQLYKETSGGTWSVLRTAGDVGNSTSGQGLGVFADFLYYAASNDLGRYGPLSGTPVFSDEFLRDGTTNVDVTGGGTGATVYSTTTGVNEGATHKQTFTPTKDPVRSITIDIATKGTGDWTITVHDTNDNVIGTVTQLNASVSTGDEEFVMNSMTIDPSVEYHFHVTTTVADGEVNTNVNNDLEGAEFTVKFEILVPDADFHPQQELLNFWTIGNGRYIAKWDLATYNPNQITLKPGFKIRSITKWNEFGVYAAWQGDDIDNVESARLYYWDGIESTFNFFDDLPMGFPDVIFNDDGVLIGIYGDRGAIFIRDNRGFREIQNLPNLARGKKLEIWPGAVTKWQTNMYIGAGASTDDATFIQGAYKFASQNAQLERGLSYAFQISTGNRKATNVSIGAVAGFGKDLYLAWKDDATYGVDKVSRDDTSAAAGALESLIFDNGKPQKDKEALRLVIQFEVLGSGETITPKYKVERAASFSTGTAATESATQAILNFPDEDVHRFKEIEYGFDVTSGNGTFPVITAMWFEFDDLEEEDDAS